MTKKDFELVAEVIRELRRGSNDGQVTVERVATEFEIALRRTNGRFDSGRFLQATR